MKKRIISLLMAFVLCLMPFGVALAAPMFTPEAPTTETANLTTTVNKVLGVIQWIGVVVAVIMVMYVGVKYLTAGAGQKAEAKSTLVPMLIGAVLVAGAPTLVSWIWSAVGGQ